MLDPFPSRCLVLSNPVLKVLESVCQLPRGGVGQVLPDEEGLNVVLRGWVDAGSASLLPNHQVRFRSIRRQTEVFLCDLRRPLTKLVDYVRGHVVDVPRTEPPE